MSSNEEIERKNVFSPDEKIEMEKATIDVVNIGNVKFSKFTFEPGWSWEKCQKPLFNTESCQMAHQAYLISGKVVVKMLSTGKETEFGPGDIAYIPPGHDAWVVGNEPAVGIDISVP